MERLISLFREPDYDQWSPSHSQPPPLDPERVEAWEDEPLYFQQLLEYLRRNRAGGDVGANRADADTLIGA